MDPIVVLSSVAVVLAGIALSLFLLFSISSEPQSSTKKGSIIPGPRPIPILRNTLDYLAHKEDTLNWFLELAQEYHYNFRAHLPFTEYANFIADPQDVEYILKTNWENFDKGISIQEKGDTLFGNGIFNVNGTLWKHQRQTASHLFKVNGMKDMAVTFIKHGKDVVELVGSRVGEGIDMQNLFLRFTLDSMGQIGFGKNIGSLHSDVPFSFAFDNAQNAIENRFYNPLWKICPEFGYRESLKVMNDFAYDVISERKKDVLLAEKTDLLSRYMCLKDENGEPFSEKYLRDIILNFMIAGRDTTAQALTWTLYMLIQNPKVEEKVLEEMEEILKGELPTFDNVKDLKYLKAVLNEALRLYPPVPLDPKIAVEDDVLPSGGRIAKGDFVVWCAYSLGRIKDFWGEDVDEFKPERWLDEERVKKYHPFQFVPFQAGPRICLGQNMAYLEAKIILCLLLPRFSFRLAPNQIVRYRRSITLPAKNGLVVIPQFRVTN